MSRNKGNKTVLGAGYEKFAVATPGAGRVRAAIERALSPERSLTASSRTPEILSTSGTCPFAMVLKVFCEVVLNVPRSVRSAYSAHAQEVGVSAVAGRNASGLVSPSSRSGGRLPKWGAHPSGGASACNWTARPVMGNGRGL